ncbi:MAG: TatD family hydrolase [Marinilabiliaceae bacterium]|nr:TatD family hydrolase [Marinilabiliaceae bacterium]
MPIQFIDIHTHKNNKNTRNFSIFNHRLKRFKQILFPKTPFSCGIHPWDIKDASDIELLSTIQKDKELFAIGECGFDKNINIPFSVQTEIFIKHVELSEKNKIPLIIHSVGYFNEIIALFKDIQPSEKWIIHGFSGHPQLAKQLVETGLMLSFGKSIFFKDSKAIDALFEVPLNSFFLETDENAKSIEDLYLRAADLKKMTVDELKLLIFENFEKVFNRRI